MTMHEQNGYLILGHLSDIELYYSPPESIFGKKIILEGDEFHHAVNVMRNSTGHSIYITDGEGKIFKSEIVEITKSKLEAIIVDKFQNENNSVNIWFCIPVLKNPDRLKFAFEKCVELGITNFILFDSNYSISKKINTEKLKKITLAAMKQSLRSFLPTIITKNFEEIMKLPGTKILFNQNSKNNFDGKINDDIPTYFLFGPEGGFNTSEMKFVNMESQFCLSKNRLRSETAIIKCASLLNLL